MKELENFSAMDFDMCFNYQRKREEKVLPKA